MKKIFLLSMIVSFVAPSLWAQKNTAPIPLENANVEATWGPVKRSRLGGGEIIGYTPDGGFYTYENLKANIFTGFKYGVRYYDSNFLLKRELINAVDDKENAGDFAFFHRYGDKSFLFTSKYVQQEKKTELRLQKFDNNNMPQGDAQIVNSMSRAKDKGSSDNISSNSNVFSSKIGVGYSFISSRNDSKLLLFKNYTSDYIGSDDKTEHYELTMLDAANDMAEVWKEKVDLPYESALFELKDACVDNKGNVYLVGVVFSQKRKRYDAEGRPNYDFKIFGYNANGKMFESRISLADKFITDLKLDISANGKLACAGFYSKDRKTASVNGVYFLSIDSENGAVLRESYKEFEIDMLTENMKEQQAKRIKKRAEKGKDIPLYEFLFNDLIPRSDGGAIMIAEQYYWFVTTSTTYSKGVSSTTYTYHYRYNDILVINITPDGEIEWAHKIHKSQATQNDGGIWSSYAFINTGKDLRFIYNDNGKNTLEKAPKDYKAFIGPTKGAMLVVAGVDRDGKVDRKLLFKVRNKNSIIRPQSYIQTGENTLILKAIKGRKSQFVRLLFK